jgi:hypothetical protein
MFVSEAFVHVSVSGDVSQDATGAVHRLLFVALALISATFPGAPQTAAKGVLELWLRHSHAPFFPPEKAIFPPWTNVVGLAVTATLAEPKRAIVWLSTSALRESPTALQNLQLMF